jgi:TolB protein
MPILPLLVFGLIQKNDRLINTKVSRSFPYMFRVNFLIFFIVIGAVTNAFAQTEIVISGAQAGFPVAVSQMCSRTEGAGDVSIKIPSTISKDLQISGLFKLIDPANFLETPGSCKGPEEFAYTDWTVIGAEGLVKGEVTEVGKDKIRVDLFLFDVLQQKPVIARRYTGGVADTSMIAHRFANEILLYFTGEKGIFGTRIAYVGSKGRFKELFVIDLDGSDQKQITNDRGLVFSPSWSADGSKLVYTSYVSRTPELYISNSDGGGNATRVTNRTGLEVGAKFRQGGGSLVSSASYEGISKLVLFDLKGSVIKKLTSSSSIDVSPSYSPDESKLAFCSNRGGGPQVYTMDSDGSNVKRISYVDSRYCTSPVWSPKGDKIAFVCAKGGFQIFMSDAEGRNAVQLTFSGDNEDPSWAPDGRFLAFSSTNLGGGEKQLGILSLLGGRPTRIEGTSRDSRQPAWSPAID